MKKIFFLVLINFFSIAKAQVWDNSFAQNGIRKFIIDGGSTEGEQVIALSDGGLLVGVNSVIPIFHAPDERSFYIYKLHTDGTLNTDFGTNGYFFVPDGGGSEFLSNFFSMEYDALNHSLYIVGTVQGIRKLIKLDSFGHLDTSFGVNGMIEFEDFTRIALQNDGKIIVTGDKFFNKNSRRTFHKIARYHPNGALDSLFGISGLLIHDLTEYKHEYIRAVKIQSDDKIVVVGRVLNSFRDQRAAITRYTADGILDTSFGTNGYTITDVGDEKTGEFKDVDISTDGKIIAAGRYSHKNGTGGWGGSQALLVKYSKDGILDETFADKGIKIFNSLNGANDNFKAVTFQDDNKIVAAGNSGNYFPNPLTYFYITRVHSDGTIDHSFFTDGVLITNFNTDEANSVRDLEIDSEKNILAIGVTRPSSTAIFNAILCRFSDNTLTTVTIVADRKISLYPNPTNDFLMIRSATSIQKIEVYDVHGKIVLEDNTNYVDTVIIADIKNLQRGVYFVKLRTQNGTWVQKIMKY